jgi:ABC-type bacteriocin/lantibiotic exporter with double-glycine peptidase domain
VSLIRWIIAAGVCLSASASDVWIDVPFVRQEPDGCGAAALAMVQDYWAVHRASVNPADAPAIQRRLYVPAERGIPASAMRDYLQGLGFRTFVLSGEFQDLMRHVSQGRPLITAIRSGKDTLHYVVVTGVSDAAVLVNDPADRKLRKYDRREFEKRWDATGRWTLLAVPPES